MAKQAPKTVKKYYEIYKLNAKTGGQPTRVAANQFDCDAQYCSWTTKFKPEGVGNQGKNFNSSNLQGDFST